MTRLQRNLKIDVSGPEGSSGAACSWPQDLQIAVGLDTLSTHECATHGALASHFECKRSGVRYLSITRINLSAIGTTQSMKSASLYSASSIVAEPG